MFQFFQDVYLGVKTFMAGMKVTGVYFKNANLNPKETITTIAYDGTQSLAQGVRLAERFRGHLQLDAARCVACKACMKVCPVDAIWVDAERTEAGKFRVSRFDIDQLKCMYCGLCTRVCPTGGLTMGKVWWGATFHTDDGTNMHGQLRRLGLGYYTDEQKIEIERKRQEAAEAKKAAAAAAAKKKAEEAAAQAAPAAPPAAPAATDKKPDTPPAA